MILIRSYCTYNNLKIIIVLIWLGFMAYPSGMARIFICHMLRYWRRLIPCFWRKLRIFSCILISRCRLKNLRIIPIIWSLIIIMIICRGMFIMALLLIICRLLISHCSSFIFVIICIRMMSQGVSV